MAIPLIMQYILIVSFIAFVGLLFRRLFRLELTLSSLLAGILGAVLIGYLHLDTGIRATNVKDLIFFVVLPLLIFVASWHIKIEQFRSWFWVCCLLATVGLLISAGLTAAGVYFAIDHPTGFPWLAALLVGVMLAATDPVSVSEQLKQEHAPEGLQTLFEGESLLNDATAIVIFSLVLTYALNQQPETHAAIEFSLVFSGGLLVGILLGAVAAGLVRLLRDRSASVVILIITAFASFYIAEHLLHVSGILAVMMAAMSSRFLLKDAEAALLSSVVPTWEWIGLFLNAVIFSLMGLLITWDMFTDQWLAIVIAIVVSLFARILAVYSITLLTLKTRRRIPWSWANLLAWGGLKGAIAIVLVLSLPLELEYWWTIQSIVFGVVLFSLLVQSTSFPALLRRLPKNLI
ncbi:cation:proton antiporter [Sulfuriflexus mobilis]|uniref:cation:proton antiporter n=1 Tax=Sulfuriflexus mobilis TaxID=1811807 RepID=UPI0015593019|nr:sodium:proton antiporter [Sulfuriflexus mobilis]